MFSYDPFSIHVLFILGAQTLSQMEQCIVFPVLPGKEQELIEFASVLTHDRRAEFDASQQTVTKESWYLQRTSQGTVCIVHVLANDPMAVFQGLAHSQDPFDVWFRERVMATTGVDLRNPPSELPLCIFDWKRT